MNMTTIWDMRLTYISHDFCARLLISFETPVLISITLGHIVGFHQKLLENYTIMMDTTTAIYT
jgi:hypothetical protein